LGFLRNQNPKNASMPIDHGMDDAELVAQYKLGGAEAFALLFRRYQPKIYAYTYDRLGNAAAAEDATQTVFFRALRAMDRYRESGQFQSWLFVIAARTCTDELRAKGRIDLPLDIAPERESPDPSPEEQAVDRDRVRSLRRARDECLSEQDRTLFDLVVQDLTSEEIATVLGKRCGAIRQAHLRLIERLRVCLGILTTLKGGRDVAS